ncbi:3721_t:CDS:1, partial [Cetraspora pellucida]
MYKWHYQNYVDKKETPSQDCPNWTLSSDALNQLSISEPKFDTDYSTGEEDPREEKKKVKCKQSKKEAGVRKDSKRKEANVDNE